MFTYPIGFMQGAGGGGGTPAVTYIGRTASTANQSTYTFTSQAIGPAASDRLVVVGVLAGFSGSTRNISSVTIDGVSAPSVAVSGTTNAVASLRSLVVTSGTTATIIVTFDSTVSNCDIEVYTVTGITSTTPTDTTTSPNTPIGFKSLNVSAGGVAIGVALSTDAGSATWTGLTEDSDNVAESTFTAASKLFPTAQTPLTITATFTSENHTKLAAASWR